MAEHGEAERRGAAGSRLGVRVEERKADLGGEIEKSGERPSGRLEGIAP